MMILLLFLSSLFAAETARVAVTTSEAASLIVEQLGREVGPNSISKCQTAPVGECNPEDFKKYPRGGHGQLFFGKGPFYISHLPLWVQPHNFQAIYEVDFPESPEGKALKEAYLKHATKGYATFNPDEVFRIPEFNCSVGLGSRVLAGELFADHFERGGKSMGSVTLEVKRRVFYRELPLLSENEDSAKKAETSGEYFVFGEGDQFFAARVIDKRPAVDHIVALDNPSAFRSKIGGLDHVCFQVQQNAQALEFEQRACSNPGALVMGSAGKSESSVINQKMNSLYLETGELR